MSCYTQLTIASVCVCGGLDWMASKPQGSQVHTTMPPRFTWMLRFKLRSFCSHSKHFTTELPLALAQETSNPYDSRLMGEALAIWVYLTLTQTQSRLPIEVGFSTLVLYALRLKQLGLARIPSDTASGLLEASAAML